MLNDAVESTTKSAVMGLLGKGVEKVLTGAGGQAVGIIFNLLVKGTTDPTAAMLEKIYDELSAIKSQIKNLPHATSVFVIYENAINDAQLHVETIADLLSFTDERKEIFGTYESYLSSLKYEQWKGMAKFLTIDPDKTYYSFINSILRAAYGVNIANITQAAANGVITYGESSQSYARVVSQTELDTLPVNFTDYVESQITIRNSVLTAIAGIIACSQLILKTFKNVAGAEVGEGIIKANSITLDNKSKEKIIAALNNPEIQLNFSVTEQKPLPYVIAKLWAPILTAPQYLCGNAFTVYNAITIDKQKIQLKNVGAKKSLVISGPEGASFANRIAGHCDYWSTDFSDAAFGWITEFKNIKDSTVTISAPNIGYLYMYNPDATMANRIWVSPSKTNFGEFGYGRNSYTWKLQLVPKGSIKSGAGSFYFVIINIKEDKALVNRKFLIDSKGIGSYSLEKDNADHQWELIPV